MTKYLLVRPNFSFFHTVHSVEKWKIYSHNNFFSSNQLFSDFFSKTVAFTKFLPKKCEREFLQFPHCECVRVNFRNFHTVLCSHNCVIISVDFTKLFPTEFLWFPHGKKWKYCDCITFSAMTLGASTKCFPSESSTEL